MSSQANRQVRLKSRPIGIPQPDHFEIVTAPLPDLADRQFLVRNEYLSVEPAMRGWVSAVANYSTPVGIGEVMRAFSAGTIVASRHPNYREGDTVMGMLGWQEYAISDGSTITRKVKENDLPLSLSLGVLGLNGVTAYFGLLDVGEPRPRDTLVVSTAAGAVGSAVGQIAKLMGCRTVGLTGGPIKCKLCRDEFGYDEVIDYKADSLADAVVRACPRGVDVYFDNTAGAISDVVLPQLAIGARVVICGTASVSSWDPPPMGPRVERHILVKRARMAGILVFDYQHRYEEAVTRLAEWVRQGHAIERTLSMGLKIAQVPSPDFTGEKTSVSGLFIFAITEVARTCPPLLLARTPPGQTPVYRHRPADLKKGLKSNGGYRPCLLRTLPKYGRSSGK